MATEGSTQVKASVAVIHELDTSSALRKTWHVVCGILALLGGCCLLAFIAEPSIGHALGSKDWVHLNLDNSANSIACIICGSAGGIGFIVLGIYLLVPPKKSNNVVPNIIFLAVPVASPSSSAPAASSLIPTSTLPITVKPVPTTAVSQIGTGFSSVAVPAPVAPPPTSSTPVIEAHSIVDTAGKVTNLGNSFVVSADL